MLRVGPDLLYVAVRLQHGAAKAPNGASISAAMQSRPTIEHPVNKVKPAIIQGLVSLRSSTQRC